MTKIILTLIALLLATPADAQTVTDGDTLKLDGISYRLHGIDAPESKQSCPDGYPAGTEATAYLRALIRDRHVTCEPRVRDRYGRTVALCRADGFDLGREMVRAGHALAYTRFSRDYELDESDARANDRGMHGRGCVEPWTWRQNQRSSP